MERMNGVIIRLFLSKGYGFVRDEREQVRFFYAGWMKAGHEFDRLREGQSVRFMPQDIPSNQNNGLRATQVEVV